MQLRLCRRDAQLVEIAYGRQVDLIVAEEARWLEAQLPFLRTPFFLLRAPLVVGPSQLTLRACACVRSSGEIGLAIDQFVAHQRLAKRAATRREPPTRCSRCGRSFNALAGQQSIARGFV